MTTDTRDRERDGEREAGFCFFCLVFLFFFSLDRCEAPGAGAFETNITQERVRKSMKLNGGFR